MSQEYEIRLKYKTKSGKYEEIKDSQPSPQNRQKVYFTCHSDDFDKYFDEITNEILSRQPNNTCIYFYDEETDNEEERDFDLNQMILFVIPVTYNFIRDDNCQARKDFKFAEENNISMLLLQQDYGLEEEFNRKCGNYQMLSKFPSLQNSQFYDPTAITYEEKLTKYLESKIIGDELVKEIQNAFDAYIFLSYRKKDRKYAQELMKLIHNNDFCRDIAIWYDEFLVSGEDFNEAIKAAMEKSNLFSMVVTPNLINEENYVQSTEYPAAKKAGKPVFPAESVPTDRDKLKELYPDIPDAVSTNGAEFSDELLNAIHKIAIKENDKDPKHNYLIGLAYLNGIDVEKDTEKGIHLITSAAEAGLYEAQDKLYRLSKEYWSENEPEKAEIIAEIVYNCCEDAKIKASVSEFMSRMYRDIMAYKEAEKYSLEALRTMYDLAKESSDDLLYVSASCHTLSTIYIRINRLAEAEKYCKEALRISRKFAKENPEKYMECVVTDCHTLARVCQIKHNYKESEKLLLEAMKLSCKIADNKPEHGIGYIASSSFNLADLYEKTNRFNEAEKQYEKAIEILQKEVEEKPDATWALDYLAIVCKSFAGLYSNTNRRREAELLFLKVLKIYRDLSEKNILVYYKKEASICHSLANFYWRVGRLKEAEELIKEAVGIFENLANSRGIIIPELAGSYLTFAYIYERKKWYRHSKSQYNNSLKIYLELENQNPGTYLVQLTRVYNGLANTYSFEDNFEQAEKMYFKAIEMREKLCSINSDVYMLEIVDPYLNLAILYRDHGRESEAEIFYLKGIETLENYGKNGLGYIHTKLYRAYESLADLYKKCKRHEDEEVSLRKAIGIIESQPYIDDRDIYSLSSIYENISKIKTDDLHIEYLLKKSIDVLININEKNAKMYFVYMGCCYNNLAEFYHSKGNNKEAENCYLIAFENSKKLKPFVSEKEYISICKNECNEIAAFYKEIGLFDKAEEISSLTIQ